MKPSHNRFQSYDLDSNEEELAKNVNPYTFAYLQNKIAAYANAVLEFEYIQESPMQQQVIEHEKLKAQVVVLEELMRELNVPMESTSDQR